MPWHNSDGAFLPAKPSPQPPAEEHWPLWRHLRALILEFWRKKPTKFKKSSITPPPLSICVTYMVNIREDEFSTVFASSDFEMSFARILSSREIETNCGNCKWSYRKQGQQSWVNQPRSRVTGYSHLVPRGANRPVTDAQARSTWSDMGHPKHREHRKG